MNNLPERYILYGEDDLDDQQLLQQMIQETDPDLAVICVNDGLHVLQFLEQVPAGENYPCFIILDINMPMLDGIQTLKIIKQQTRHPDIPIVMFSTSTSAKDIAFSLQLGAKEFISKPIHHQSIIAVTEKFAHFCHAMPLLKKTA